MQSFTTKAEDARALAHSSAPRLSLPPLALPAPRPAPTLATTTAATVADVQLFASARALPFECCHRNGWLGLGRRQGREGIWTRGRMRQSERERASERGRVYNHAGASTCRGAWRTHQRSPRGARRCPRAPAPTSGRNETAPGACPRRHRLNRRCRPPCLRSAARPRPRRQPPRRRRSVSASEHGPASVLVMRVGREEGSRSAPQHARASEGRSLRREKRA